MQNKYPVRHSKLPEAEVRELLQKQLRNIHKILDSFLVIC